MTFTNFIQKHKSEAIQVDLKNTLPNVYAILQEQKNKLEYATFESEILEVTAVAEKGAKDLKLILLRYFEQGQSTQFPNFIFELRCFFEYTELYNKAIELKEQKTIKAMQDEVIIDEPKKPQNKTFELKQNKFDDVKPIKVIEHFKILHENGYISEENFELFIKTRFADDKNLTDKIELLKENSRVQFKKIFYKYYDTVINQKYGKKPKYVNLLCENFTGFDYDAISTNFSD